MVQPSVQVNDRLVLLVERQVVSQSNDLVLSDTLCIKLTDSLTELWMDYLLGKPGVMAHQIKLLVIFSFVSVSTILRLSGFFNCCLCKNDTKVNALVDQCCLNALKRLVNFWHRLDLTLGEELWEEVRQVKVLDYRCVEVLGFRQVFRLIKSFCDYVE